MAKPTETASEYPRPELFWPDDIDDAPEAMSAPIATMRVYKLGTNSERDQIDTTTPDALPNRNAFRDAYGPGLYEVQGRSNTGAIVAKVTFRVSMPPGRVWRPPSGQDTAPEATPAPMQSDGRALDPMSLLLHETLRDARSRGQDPTITLLLTHVLSLSKEMATQSQESNARIIDAIAHLSGARLQDQQDLFKTLLNAKAATAGTDPVKAFQAGMDRVVQFYRSGEEAEAAGGGDVSEASLVKAFFEGMAALKDGSPSNVVPMQPGTGGNRAAS